MHCQPIGPEFPALLSQGLSPPEELCTAENQLCTTTVPIPAGKPNSPAPQNTGFALCQMQTHEDMHSSASSASFYWQQLLSMLCAATLVQHSQQCAGTSSGSPLVSALPQPVGASSEILFLAVHHGRLAGLRRVYFSCFPKILLALEKVWPLVIQSS